MNPQTLEVTLATPYDLDIMGTPTAISCKAFVTDKEYTGTATLSINVNYANDNPPVFANQEYAFSMSRDVHVGEEIGSITATDADCGVDGMDIHSDSLFCI